MEADVPIQVDAAKGNAAEQSPPYDAILLVSFGGPERPEEVLPFLENVVRGKNVPSARLAQVAAHYDLFEGVSPMNAQLRALLAALVDELDAAGLALPVYWGNRNWHPLLTDTVRDMTDDGVRRALAFVTSAFGSYPSCRQYCEDIAHARETVGAAAPPIDKLRLFYNHPGFVAAMADRVISAFAELPDERRAAARLIFTAHSIPLAMAEQSPYERHLREACRLVCERIQTCLTQAEQQEGEAGENIAPPAANVGDWSERWQLVYQSRSGPPSQPWLEPNLGDYLREEHAQGGLQDIVIVPIGFLVEHMEVVYDLDVEIGGLCDELGVNMVRAAVVGSHPRFVQMIRELIVERLDPSTPRLALGADGPWPDECPSDCCRQA